MKPIILELPETVKQVQIKDKTYSMNTDDLELCRKISALADDAGKIMDGEIPSDEQIEKILEKCKGAIDLALGKGAYDEITDGGQGRRRYLLPLYVIGQLKDICDQTELEYVSSRYSPDRIQPGANPEQYLQLLAAINNLPGAIERLEQLTAKGNGN